MNEEPVSETLLEPAKGNKKAAEGNEFASRHIGSSPNDQQKMLDFLGLSSLDELVEQTVPETIRDHNPLSLPEARTEYEVLAELRALADQNKVFTSLIGMGYYDTISPQVIIRCVLEKPPQTLSLIHI